MWSWTEPEWDDEDVDVMIAFDIVTRNTGPNGEWLPDATSPAADPTEYGSGYRFVSSGPHINWAEKTRLDAMDAHKKALGDTPNLNGVYFTVERLDYDV